MRKYGINQRHLTQRSDGNRIKYLYEQLFHQIKFRLNELAMLDLPSPEQAQENRSAGV